MNFIRHTPSPSGASPSRPFRLGGVGAESVPGVDRLSPAARVARLAWFDLASGATCRALAAAGADGGHPLTPRG